MSSSWIWSDKITNERVARAGYNHFISNKGEWNNCFSKFSNRVLPPIFISTINFTKLPERKFLNLAHYLPYNVKLRLLAHSSLANQKARNAIVGAENLPKTDSRKLMCLTFLTRERFYILICLILVTVLFLLINILLTTLSRSIGENLDLDIFGPYSRRRSRFFHTDLLLGL